MFAMQIVVGVVLCILFWGSCYMDTGTDKKNIGGFRSYPDEAQNRVYQDEVLRKMIPKKRSTFITLVSNILLFTVVFTVIGLVGRGALGLQDFKTAAWYFFWLGEGLNLFDLVVIDLCWWRNTKRIRFSCVPEKEAYQNPKKTCGFFFEGNSYVCGSSGNSGMDCDFGIRKDIDSIIF